MNPDLVAVDVEAALESDALTAGGVAPAELDALVGRGRQVHDDLLLARARGQVGFGDLYMLGREAMRAREVAESLAGRFDNVAVLATGAEADVAASLLDALAHPYHNLLPAPGRAGRPRVVRVDSIDPEQLGALLEALPIEQTLLVTLSRTGSDLSSLLQFAAAREIARKRVGPGFQDHLVVVTDPRGGHLREEALRHGLLAFEVPANVPPRYAALTPVGLFPAAIAGIDVRSVLGGAHAAAERTAGEDLRTNPAYLLASVLHVLAAGRGRRHHLFVSGHAALASTAAHLAHLFEESVGAAAAEPAARRRCASACLPRDASVLVERVGTGAADLVVVLLESGKPARDQALPADGPGVEWMAGRSLADAAAVARTAFRRSLREAGVPCAVVRIPSLTPQPVGALHMTAMLAGAFAAGLAGGEPFAPRLRAPGDAVLEEELRRGRS